MSDCFISIYKNHVQPVAGYTSKHNYSQGYSYMHTWVAIAK